jgi:hypothetical protein
MPGYTCRCCGKRHPDLPMHYGSAAPDAWFDLPDATRDRRALLSSDQCLIDERRAFLVGNLEIPVLDAAEHFSWDVWVSLSFKDFARASRCWDTPGRESELPYAGRIATSLPTYPDTVGLRVRVHTRKVGVRPRLEVTAKAHPLVTEQQTGITLARVQQIAEAVLHGAA